MDAVFYFHFYDHHNDFTPSRSLAFYATNISTTWEQLDETIAYCAEDMYIKYGEHCGLVSATRNNTIGYMSSQIEGVETQNHLMDVWREIFAQRIPGCVVGEVFDATDVPRDAEIFERTKQAHEQQQAKKLRTTLNEHIANVQINEQLPSPTKKI